MKTLARDSNNDIFISARQLALVDGKAAECVLLDSVVNTQKGELQFDKTRGIDYFGTVFDHQRYIEVWAGQVKTAVKKMSWVDSISSFTYSFDASSGTVKWSMTVKDKDGTTSTASNNSYISSVNPRGMGVDWDEIINKPEGLDTALKGFTAMRSAADNKDLLVKKNTLSDVKNVVNDVLLSPVTGRTHTPSGTSSAIDAAVAQKIAAICATLDPETSSIADIIKAFKGG